MPARRNSNAFSWRFLLLVVPVLLFVAAQYWLTRPAVPELTPLDQAVEALQAGRLDEARAGLQSLFAEQPGNAEVGVILATVMGLQGDAMGALQVLESLPGFAGNPGLLLKAAQIAIEGHFISRADQYAAQSLELAPENIDTLRLLAYLRTTLLESVAARPMFIQLDKLGALTGPDVLTCLMADRARYDIEENRRQLEAALDRDSGSPRILAAIIENDLTLNQTAKAESRLQQVRVDPRATDLWRLDAVRAATAAAREQFDTAADVLSRLPEEADRIPRIWLLKARVLDELGRTSEAITSLQNAAALDPLDPEPPYLIARLLLSSGGDASQAAMYRDRATLLQDISVRAGGLLNVESEAEAAERLPALCEQLIVAGAAREAAAILSWLRTQGYSFAAIAEAESRLQALEPAAPRFLSSRPVVPLQILPADVFRQRELTTSETTPPVDTATTAVFEDITATSGIEFEYECPESNRTEILSSLGGGVACFDIDHDGHVDFYFPQGGPSPEDLSVPRGTGRGFRRRGLAWSDVTSPAGLEFTAYSQGTAVADVNNDGFDDLLVTGFDRSQLWLNLGDGTFQPLSPPALILPTEWFSSAVFADLDNDGDSDLYVVNYLTELCPAVRVTECGPRTLNAHPHDRLFENRGDGTFEDVSQAVGMTAPGGKGLGVIAADLDHDGRLDVFVGNDSTGNFLFANRTSGREIRLENIAVPAGVAVGASGVPQACMGIAIADVNGNSLPDLFVSNFELETNTLYSNLGGLQFSDDSRGSGLEAGSYALMGWGAQFLDLNDDWRPDLALLNGYLDARPMRPQVYRNSERGFVDVTNAAGSWFQEPRTGRGLAIADLNNDAAADLIATFRSGRPALLQQVRDTELQFSVLLSGRNCSRDAVGTRVTVTVDGHSVTRELYGGGGYLCANQRVLFLPCDSDRQLDTVRIEWPDGRVDAWSAVKVGTRMLAVQSSDAAAARLVEQ
jgi:predicted Zn-dependent protease